MVSSMNFRSRFFKKSIISRRLSFWKNVFDPYAEGLGDGLFQWFRFALAVQNHGDPLFGDVTVVGDFSICDFVFLFQARYFLEVWFKL